MCGHRDLLPKSLRIPVCYDQSGMPHYNGGYADVWMGDHQGLRVAVKVLRVYRMSDFNEIRMVRCASTVPTILVGTLNATHAEVLQGSYHVGSSWPPERVATARSDDGRESIYNDIGMDDKREHQ